MLADQDRDVKLMRTQLIQLGLKVPETSYALDLSKKIAPDHTKAPTQAPQLNSSTATMGKSE